VHRFNPEGVCAFIEGRAVVVAYQSAMARKPQPQALPWLAPVVALWRWCCGLREAQS